jgi:hypothetical protein
MNFRRFLSIAGLVFLALGTLDIIGGLGYSLLPPGKPVSDTVAFTFYTQNHRFFTSPQFDLTAIGTEKQQGFGFEVVPRWVERAVLAFDREPRFCVAERGQRLHVFVISERDRRLFAVGFFLWRDTGGLNDIGPAHSYVTCSFGAQPISHVRYHPASFAWFDPMISRKRLEYIAHAELRDLPAATYPAHDKTMYPVRIASP